MAKNYMPVPYDFLDEMEELTDAEWGRLMRWCLNYCITGEAEELRGNERFYAKRCLNQINRFNANYDELSKKRKKAGETGGQANGSKTKQNEANGSKTGETQTKTQTQTHTHTNAPTGAKSPLPPLPGGWGEELINATRDWFAYKAENRQAYKEIGAKSLVSQIGNAASQHGEAAVADVIRRSMAANYKGIVWDWLQQPKTKQQIQQEAQSDGFGLTAEDLRAMESLRQSLGRES